MRKLFAIILLMGIFASVNAQELVSPKGFKILPEKGDYALGIDAAPFFTYIGNMFNGTANNAAPIFNYKEGGTHIYGKKFISDNSAIRMRLRIGFNSDSDREIVDDDLSAIATNTVEDKETVSNLGIVISGGLEKRRGHGRLQGIYGGELGIIFISQKSKYSYGNDVSATNLTPTSTDFGTNILAPGNRVLENKTGSQFGFALRAFVGVEYFFAPKMSIGGEFGWSINMLSQGDGERKSESWDGVNGEINEATTKFGGTSHFGIDTDNLNGQIYLLFHF